MEDISGLGRPPPAPPRSEDKKPNFEKCLSVCTPVARQNSLSPVKPVFEKTKSSPAIVSRGLFGDSCLMFDEFKALIGQCGRSILHDEQIDMFKRFEIFRRKAYLRIDEQDKRSCDFLKQCFSDFIDNDLMAKNFGLKQERSLLFFRERSQRLGEISENETDNKDGHNRWRLEGKASVVVQPKIIRPLIKIVKINSKKMLGPKREQLNEFPGLILKPDLVSNSKAVQAKLSSSPRPLKKKNRSTQCFLVTDYIKPSDLMDRDQDVCRQSADKLLLKISTLESTLGMKFEECEKSYAESASLKAALEHLKYILAQKESNECSLSDEHTRLQIEHRQIQEQLRETQGRLAEKICENADLIVKLESECNVSQRQTSLASESNEDSAKVSSELLRARISFQQLEADLSERENLFKLEKQNSSTLSSSLDATNKQLRVMLRCTQQRFDTAIDLLRLIISHDITSREYYATVEARLLAISDFDICFIGEIRSNGRGLMLYTPNESRNQFCEIGSEAIALFTAAKVLILQNQHAIEELFLSRPELRKILEVIEVSLSTTSSFISYPCISNDVVHSFIFGFHTKDSAHITSQEVSLFQDYSTLLSMLYIQRPGAVT